MRIRYENTVDDFVALARFHNDHSPAARRVRLRATGLFAIGVLTITAGIAYKMWEAERERGDEPWLKPVVMSSLLLAALALALVRLPAGFRRQAERQARRMYAEGANKSVLGARELELVGDVLISRAAYAESRLRLEAVERVVTSGAYTLIFVNALTAHVIPHGAVTEGDPERFAEAVRRRLNPGTI